MVSAVVAGGLTPVEASPIAFAVRADTGDSLWSIDLATGKATEFGFIPFGAEGLEFLNGRLYAIDGDTTTTDQLYDVTPPGWVPTVWPNFGLGTPVGPTGDRLGLDAALAADATGRLYNLQGWPSYDAPASHLYEINPLTGAASYRWSAPVYADAFAIDAAGQGYAMDGKVTDALYRVDLLTGAVTLIGSLGLGDLLVHAGMAFDPDGLLWLITTGITSEASRIYRVDPHTGVATFTNFVTVDLPGLGTFGKNGFQSLAIDTFHSRGTQSPPAAAVPEPALWSLVMCGWLFVRHRRR